MLPSQCDPMQDEKNQLYFGDNLDVLRRYVRAASVDLIYLDPPFNSRQEYSVLFAEKDGSQSSSQIRAFKDTWEWNMESERAYLDVVENGGRVADAMVAYRKLLGNSDMMAYLAMMAPRLQELHRVLKDTGSLYLHCDPTASHYLKILLDAVFGAEMYRNEIIWQRTSARSDSHRWNHIHDVIFFYSKSDAMTWNPQFTPYTPEYVKKFYRFVEPETGKEYASDNLTATGTRNGSSGENWRGINVRDKGLHWKYTIEKLEELDRQGRILWPQKQGGVGRYKRYLDEMPGVAVQSMITDIPPLSAQSAERLGYPTQKPEALLERIVKASSNAGDVVLDPFCGCGTTVQVAQKLNRKWIGIDITHLAVGLIKTRLSDTFGEHIRNSYQVVGEPTDVAGAATLAQQDKYQFQWWALGLVGARPAEQKKGADRGIDGRLYFHDDQGSGAKQILFSVKAGGVTVAQVRDLRGTLEREKAEMGVFLCMEPPTKPMLKEAAEAGFYKSPDNSVYPRLQILTVEELLQGQRVQYPLHRRDVTFKQAPRSRSAPAENLELPLNLPEE